MDDPRRSQTDRLYEQEREERNERRGLEQRGATVVAAVLVTLGLTANVVGRDNYDGGLGSTLFLVIGVAVTFLGGFTATFGLAGAHTSEDMSIVKAVTTQLRANKAASSKDRTHDEPTGAAQLTMGRPTEGESEAQVEPSTPRMAELEPSPITEAYVDGLRRRVARLVDENARMVVIVRVANLALGLGVYCVLFGLGFELAGG